MSVTDRLERMEEALRTIRGPADSGPFMDAYREAGGGYEGLQAIARVALGDEESRTETEAYDSRPDTYAHIERVRAFLLDVAGELLHRAHVHDKSKLVEPELSVFNEYTPKLRDSTYGSLEYESFREGMGEGLRHHYANNDHHPEHHENGVEDMDLVQVIEMLADWKAATLRHADGSLQGSIMQNAERFGYGDEFERLLYNTAKRLDWL